MVDLTRNSWRIRKQRDKHLKELIQPFNDKGQIDKNFVKIYGSDIYENEFGIARQMVIRALDRNWNIDQIRKQQKRFYGQEFIKKE